MTPQDAESGPRPFSDRPNSPRGYLRLSPLLAFGQGLIWLMWVLSDQCEPVSARTVRLSLITRKDRAIR
jgi:hypothetical protein